MLQLMREDCSYTYPPLSIARYSFIQLSELEQCRVKNFPMALTPQHTIRNCVLLVESPKLYPLNHCTLRVGGFILVSVSMSKIGQFCSFYVVVIEREHNKPNHLLSGVGTKGSKQFHANGNEMSFSKLPTVE